MDVHTLNCYRRKDNQSGPLPFPASPPYSGPVISEPLFSLHMPTSAAPRPSASSFPIHAYPPETPDAAPPILPGSRYHSVDLSTISVQAHHELPPRDGPVVGCNFVGCGCKPEYCDTEAIHHAAPAMPCTTQTDAGISFPAFSLPPPMGAPSLASPTADHGSDIATHADPGPQSGAPMSKDYAGPPQPPESPAADAQPAGPSYRYGIVAAVSAHAHIRRIKKQLEELFDFHEIGAHEWNAQAGFRTTRTGDGEEVELPPTLPQEIIITFTDYASVRGKISHFSDELKERIAPFYGAVQYRNSTETIDLKSQSGLIADTNCNGEFLVGGCSGSRGKSAFDVDEPDASETPTATRVKLSVINFANDRNPENHFTTSAAFALQKVGNAGQTSIEFSELRFTGPRQYRLQSSFARVVFDQPSCFESVSPDEMLGIDVGAQYKHSAQSTAGKEIQYNAGVEIGRDPKVTVGASQVKREEDMKAEETMRNCWKIRHSEDEKSKTIRYFSMRPEFKERMSFPASFRPSIASTSNSRSSPPSTVTVRVWSFWTLAPAPNQGPGPESMFKRMWHRLVGKPESAGGGTRTYTNLVHCIEAAVPLDFVGAARKTVVREVVLDELLDGDLPSELN